MSTEEKPSFSAPTEPAAARHDPASSPAQPRPAAEAPASSGTTTAGAAPDGTAGNGTAAPASGDSASTPAPGNSDNSDTAVASAAPVEQPAAAEAGPGSAAADATDSGTPAADSLPLPAGAQAIDERIRAALIMVAHGNARLSRLAGNIRFSYLQRDESRLIAERKRLKTAFQRGESSEAALQEGLQALLQKAERQAGSLLAPPARPASDPPAEALSGERSNQLRRALREAMMSLAAAAPLHLQIELAAEFSEAEPDIMAMAARTHALHRAVLGSLKRIRWFSPHHCELGFDDSKAPATVEARFGEQGITELPEAFRQAAPRPAPAASRPARHKNKPRTAAAMPGQAAADGSAKPAGRPPRRGNPAGRRPGGAAATAAPSTGNRQPDSPAQAAAKNQPRQQQAKPPRAASPGARPPHPGNRGTDARQDGAPGSRGERRPSGKRPQRSAQGTQPERRDHGSSPRTHKAFPGNSAMADKLREVLGGQLSLKKTRKE